MERSSAYSLPAQVLDHQLKAWMHKHVPLAPLAPALLDHPPSSFQGATPPLPPPSGTPAACGATSSAPAGSSSMGGMDNEVSAVVQIVSPPLSGSNCHGAHGAVGTNGGSPTGPAGKASLDRNILAR